MTELERLLELRFPPVAISFRDAAPAGVPRIAAPEAASCGYWRRAAAGERFYTEADDHVNCFIGAHTHGVPLTPPQARELEGLIGTMVSLRYLKLEEVPAIPARRGRFGVVIYGPIEGEAEHVDVVLVHGTARQLMLLAEAAQAAGVAGAAPTMGRPTCAILPQLLESGRTASSFGCVGNRVYTGVGDDEAYFAIPGARLAAVEEKLAEVVQANAELRKFHEARRTALATPR